MQGKNTHGDALSTPLTRDKVRVARFTASYDGSDSLYGYNSLNLTLSRGLSFLGGSESGDLNLSRAAADPDFNKAEFSWGREQYISETFSLSAYFTGQMSSSPLFSSEEFGYGGFVVGRGYDPSEITGDSGAAFSIEISYNGMPDFELLQLQPFAFYDIGKVWNRDGTDDSDSGASAGFGMKIRANNTVSSTIGLAYPLTRPASSPLSGNGKNPRLMFEVSAQF
jgi:hemolysin activation/secretion protein